MSALRTILQAALLAAVASGAGAQEGVGEGCERLSPRADRRYIDAMAVEFHRFDSAIVAMIGDGRMTLSAQHDALRSAAGSRATEVIARATSGRVQRADGDSLRAAVSRYMDLVSPAIPEGSVPDQYYTIQCDFIARFKEGAEEQLRQWEVRYGPSSERLNIVEVVVEQWLFSRAAQGPLRGPARVEPILRLQAIGYQWDKQFERMYPSSPTAQVGFSYYLLADNALARAINHVGIAAAWQRDYATDRTLVGGVLHVQKFDIGLLCTSGCADHVVLASSNLSVLERYWERLRAQRAAK